MKKSIISFVVAIVLVFGLVVVGNLDTVRDTFKAGGLWSLKEANDTSKTSMTTFAEVNATTEEKLAQITSIASWERELSGYFYGIDAVGTVSTQFGVMCPTLDARGGVDFGTFRLEAKVGDFTRNSVKTSNFDPQFANFAILLGESASVSNAVQLSYVDSNTKIMVGHQAGSYFYSFKDGNYYICAEQTFGNVSVSGGVDFAENTTGYGAVKLSCKNDVFTVNGNKLGTDGQNLLLSYNHKILSLGRGINMGIGSALWLQSGVTGLHIVSGFGKGNVKLFAQAGGRWQSSTFTPMIGLGLNYKM